MHRSICRQLSIVDEGTQYINFIVRNNQTWAHKKAARRVLDPGIKREIFTILTEAKVLIADWRKEYNQFRPHSSLRYKPPAPEAKMLVTLTL